MDIQNSEENYERIKELVSDFCAIILTQKDSIDSSDIKKAEQYLDSLSPEDIGHLNLKDPGNNPQIRSIVLNKIAEYIKTFYRASDLAPISFKRPFEFNSAGTYDTFCKACEDYYETKHQRHSFPLVLKFTLQYIQEISEHYRIFGHFYDIRSAQTSDSIVRTAVTATKAKATEVVLGVSTSVAKDKVAEAVKEKMDEVTSRISETSVTILGIFSGIVLTVVAGLFYSSSVLESISDANFYRLLCISALIGFVCLHLILIMFRFIERIGKKDDKPFISNKMTVLFSVVLIVVMLGGLIMQFVFPDNDSTEAKIKESSTVCDEYSTDEPSSDLSE